MNNEVMIAITIAVAIVAVIITAANFPKIRHAFLVPEGYAGLLYHKGKFVEVLGAGRHIRWGRHFTLDAQDLRKASLLVAGQEVLTADNVGLKASLLVAYQVTDPAKAAHTTRKTGGASSTTPPSLRCERSWAESQWKRCSISGWKSVSSSWHGCSQKVPKSASTPSRSR